MTEKKDSEQNTPKTGKTRHTHAEKGRQPAGTPRLIILAAVVILAGAALLFWPRGGSVPTGIGEHQSVVISAADSNTVALGSSGKKPHSSSVDIGSESQNIVPESPDGTGLSSGEAAVQDQKIAVETQQKTVAKASAPVKTKAKTAPEEKVMPQKDGGWVVQIGAYGQATNADKEAIRIQALGWDTRVKAGNNSNGTMVFRVWIGYFTTRTIAETFARQNKRAIPNAIAVHR